MGYWIRWSLDHVKTCYQTWLFLNGLLKLPIQHSFQLYPSREAVPTCQNIAVWGPIEKPLLPAKQHSGPWVAHSRSPTPCINKHCRRSNKTAGGVCLGQLPALTPSQAGAPLPKEVTLVHQLPSGCKYQQLDPTPFYIVLKGVNIFWSKSCYLSHVGSFTGNWYVQVHYTK